MFPAKDSGLLLEDDNVLLCNEAGIALLGDSNSTVKLVLGVMLPFSSSSFSFSSLLVNTSDPDLYDSFSGFRSDTLKLLFLGVGSEGL